MVSSFPYNRVVARPQMDGSVASAVCCGLTTSRGSQLSETLRFPPLCPLTDIGAFDTRSFPRLWKKLHNFLLFSKLMQL
jgi:hypothetical protein